MDRTDLNISLLALSLSVFVAIVSRNSGLALVNAGMTGTLVLALAYGVRVASDSAPDVARGIVEFGHTITMPSRLARTALMTPTVREPDLDARWRGRLRRFMLVSKLAGTFSIAALAYDRIEHGVITRKRFMTDKGWRSLSGALVDNQCLDKTQKGTVYAAGQNYASVCRKIQSGQMTFPDKEPPEVWL